MIGNFGMGEMLLILLLVLLLFGAKRIPEIAGSMGKGIREFKKNMTDVERALKEQPSSDEGRLDRERPRDAIPAARQERAEPVVAPEAEEPRRLLG